MTTRYTIGSRVACADGDCGELVRVVIDPVAGTLTHLVVAPHGDAADARLVPLDLVVAGDGEEASAAVALRCDHTRFNALEPAQVSQFVPAEEDILGYGPDTALWHPFYPAGGLPAAPVPGGGARIALDDAPGSQVVTEERVPLGEVQIRRHETVHATDGGIGRVRGLVVDQAGGRVTHILLDEGHLWGRKTVAIPISALASATEGIRLTLSKDEVRDLPELEIGTSRHRP